MRTWSEYDSAYWSLVDKINSASQAREVLTGSLTPELKTAIRLDSVSFSYDQRLVLNDVSLVVPAGTFVVLCGPSGSGKTTIADILIGLLRPQQGEVWVDDCPSPRSTSAAGDR